jgi:hypothetical protein
VLDEERVDMERRTAEGEKDSVVGRGRQKGGSEVDGSLVSIISSSSARDIREEELPRSSWVAGISLFPC